MSSALIAAAVLHMAGVDLESACLRGEPVCVAVLEQVLSDAIAARVVCPPPRWTHTGNDLRRVFLYSYATEGDLLSAGNAYAAAGLVIQQQLPPCPAGS